MSFLSAITGGGDDAPPPETREALRNVGRTDSNRALRRQRAETEREQEEQNPLPRGWRF